MDGDETRMQIRRMLAELDEKEDPQLLPTMSLFKRITVAHRRSLERGTLKLKP